MIDLPGLSAAALATWSRTALPEWGAPGKAELIAGGLSNLTYRVQFDREPLILRRPPRGPVLPSAHDMGREYRVLSALQSDAVPVPRTVAFEPDPTVLGAPFYLVEDVAGEVYRSPTQTAVLPDADRAAVGAATIEALARIHEVDLTATGLHDFARHTGYLERQLRRWSAQWAASRTRDLPAMDALVAALAAHLPADNETTLVHGDYRLDNVIVQDRAIAAVLDWELSTLGDPLADLGLTLTYWSDLGEDPADAVAVSAGVTAYPGFPTSAEFAAAYAARTGRSLDLLPFYRAFAEFKLAVILEGVHSRYLSGGTIGAGYAHAGESVPRLVTRALAAL